MNQSVSLTNRALTFNRDPEGEARCSIATTIERHQGMLKPAELALLLLISV
jgi:hypothetical protein